MALVVIRSASAAGCEGEISVSELAARAAVAERLHAPNYVLLK